jgi:hypothetical protein
MHVWEGPAPIAAQQDKCHAAGGMTIAMWVHAVFCLDPTADPAFCCVTHDSFFDC